MQGGETVPIHKQALRRFLWAAQQTMWCNVHQCDLHLANSYLSRPCIFQGDIGSSISKCERDYLLSDTPWLAEYLSLIGHSKQQKQMSPNLIGLRPLQLPQLTRGCSQMWHKIRLGLVWVPRIAHPGFFTCNVRPLYIPLTCNVHFWIFLSLVMVVPCTFL